MGHSSPVEQPAGKPLSNLFSNGALPQQLKNIQYPFERFVGISELEIGDYSPRNEASETDDVVVLKKLMATSGLASATQWSHGDSEFRFAT